MTTVADLYTQVLGRAPDAGGLAYWESMFGSTVDPTELATFKSVAQVTEPTAVAANLFNQVDPSSAINAQMIANTPAELTTSGGTTVEDLYKKFYGTVDPAGAAYWKQQFGSTVDPVEQAKFIKEVGIKDPNVNTGVTVDQAFKTYLGNNTDKAGMDYWKQQFGTGTLTAGQLSQLTNSQYGLNDSGGGLFGGGGFLGTGLKTSDIAKAAALYYGGSALLGELGAGAAATGAGADAAFVAADAAQLAAQGLSQAAIEQNLIAAGVDSFLAADAAQLALQGIGQDQMTGLLTQSAGGTSIFAPAAAGLSNAATTGATATGTTAAGTGAATGVGTGTGLGTGLTSTDLVNLTKTGLLATGLLGGTKALTNLVGGTGTGGLTLPTQDRSGISSGSAQYSPEYYQAIQAKYNQMMPQQPRDVTTELKNWYETKYAPTATITPTTPKVA